MCFNCLNETLSSIEEYEKTVKDCLTTVECEGCRSYGSFLLGVNDDLKVLCLTKMKRQGEVCYNGVCQLMRFEGMVKKRIKNKLDGCLERIDECSHELKEQSYLNKMNDLKDLNDMVDVLDEADHR